MSPSHVDSMRNAHDLEIQVQAREKVGLVKRSFDLSPYLRAYGANEKHPAWFLSSYPDNAKLRRVYEAAEAKFD